MRGITAVLGVCLTLFFAATAAAQGEATYKKKCMTCHGPKGDGKGHADIKIEPADLRSEAVQKQTDEQLFKGIAFGVGHRDYAHGFAHRGMTGKQISDVVTYIRSFARTAKKEN